MAERDDLLASIAATMADYREGDLTVPTPQHVNKWVSQFDDNVQVPILREMDHVLKKTYFSLKVTWDFLDGLFGNKKLVGDDPCNFWKSVKFLDIQRGGESQKGMLALFSKILDKRCSFTVDDCGTDPAAFVYLDDAIFTGNRVKQDFEKWIADGAPTNAKVHIIVIALHSGGHYYASKKIKEAAKNANKNINFEWWRTIELEDRKRYTDTSDVLRPVSIPAIPTVQTYVKALGYKPKLRNSGQVGALRIFSTDDGRQLLEQEFLKAGVSIRKQCPNLNPFQRPLGNMVLDTLGFGSLIVTFRNCPNNAPLALWVGKPWYPLFPRTTNHDTSLKRFMARLEKG